MKRGSLLVVDDNSGIRRLLEVFFSAKGYTVATAASGHEALTSAQKKLPDLVLTDIKMPGMNGIVLRDKLLLLDKNIRFIFISAYTDHQEIVEIECGKDYLLPKPFDIEQLRLIVVRLLKRVRLEYLLNKKPQFRSLQKQPPNPVLADIKTDLPPEEKSWFQLQLPFSFVDHQS